MKQEISEPENRTRRIEAFSDGVFAIAITLLILEIRPPDIGSSDQPIMLGKALLNQWPSFAAYIFSFLMIGIYWANHHYLWRFYKRIDHTFILLNLLFLMCICFLPYPTELLAIFMNKPVMYIDAAKFYEIGLLLPAVTWFMAWKYASSNYRLIDRNLKQSFVNGLTRLYLLSIPIYGVAFAVSCFKARIGLIVAFLLTLSYLRPPKEPEYRS